MTPEKMEECLKDLEDAHLVVALQKSTIGLVSVLGIVALAMGVIVHRVEGLELLSGRPQTRQDHVGPLGGTFPSRAGS